MAWWSEEMAWMARMERMEREWCLQRSTLILKQTISAYRMMFVDYRTVSRWIVGLDDGCQIQWNTTIFGLFWVNHEEPLLSWMHERPESVEWVRQPRVPSFTTSSMCVDFEMILKFRAISPKSLARSDVASLPATTSSRRTRNDSSSQY